ncbi:sensor histidine kinase [Dokdonia sinensis]|uniref:histidine kinase n=1 Tax=Dokdonia sinensis TaxID=2479847 RepID=A0A3M0GEU6_9FLAO|nr:HAMP domain-containing sensor histidine kinase [Dokdonia sinensis]RMB63260.1 sensor histidine kinase [Dokdonia sinensis]
MSLRFSKNYYFLFAIIAIITAIAVVWSTSRIIEEEQATRKLRLKQANKTAATELQEALVSYATLISGVKTFISYRNDIPRKEDIQYFLKTQISDVKAEPPFSVSYIDTNHIFQFDFTMQPAGPLHLEGTSIKDIIGESGIRRMDTLMLKDSFYASDPTNLIEGRVGFPLGFGILDSTGVSRGYLTSVAEFAPIINRVYDHVDKSQFVFSFQSTNGNYFDRTRSYNYQKLTSDDSDPEYFKNFDIAENQYVYTTIPFYNKSFTVGTAYKSPYKFSTSLIISSALWYLLILGFMLFIISQLYVYKKKNATIAAQKEQLSELVATKNKFFSIIAHDLRSPLSSVINYLDVLKGGTYENSQTNNIFGQLEDSSRNSITLLDNLLKWSKIQTGQIAFNPETLDLMSITKDQIKVQSQLLEKKGLQVRLESSYSGKVTADKNMIATVIRNLLSNAIKFSRLNGIIVIEINKVENNVSFSIEDNGIGIPDDFKDNLLDITTLTRQVGTNNEKGSGLGLILCNQFIEAHKGKLAIESAFEKGTIVSFLLPL